MISVIVSTTRPEAQSIQERNIAKTVGVPHEYLLIDQTKGPSTAARFNYGIDHCSGNILVFIPDDAYFMKPNWGVVLERKFSKDPSLGCVGTAGSQFLFSDKPSLTAAGRPFIKGRIIYHLQNGDFFASVFSNEKEDFDVVACDGVFMAIKRTLLYQTHFDDVNFDGPCFYDLDVCMLVGRTHRIIVTSDIVLKRRSQPVFDKEWQQYGQKFLEKYCNELPLSCSEVFMDPEHFVPSQTVNLKGKVPVETIC